VIDFTSSLYLGLLHPSRSLATWESLTTGAPAALNTPVETRRLQARLAALQRCERATVAPSTLHLFWDLFGMWRVGGTAICFDEAMYPIGRWGVERAAALGVETRPFRHLSLTGLRETARTLRGYRTVVVTDGFCTACGRFPPLDQYQRIAAETNGYLVIDDTQAIGVFGHTSRPDDPYGRGGGGSMCRFLLDCERTVTISSLAKAFGTPMAVLAGSERLVAAFERRSECKTHCSQPSAAHVAAASRALDINSGIGDRLRRRLASLVEYFRRCGRGRGLPLCRGMFPVQSISLSSCTDLSRLQRQLRMRGIRCALQAGRHGGRRITLVITTRHNEQELEHAADAIALSIKP
jgi:8-amino-7-oxononanoate synthase